MTREEIIKYIEFRASGINQAINYNYKEFYKEILEMCKQEKQVKQNDLLHSVSDSFLTNIIAVAKQLLSEFDDESVFLYTPIAYHRKFERMRELIESAEEHSR